MVGSFSILILTQGGLVLFYKKHEVAEDWMIYLPDANHQSSIINLELTI